ncbi:MAG: magnesium transporter [Burkholderiaceae bacterium]|nr:magnesium transporter [Burkholderiaceae bacterium]
MSENTTEKLKTDLSSNLAREPEEAARGLALVQQLLDRGEEAEERKDLVVGEEVRKELRDTLAELHPADIAYVLEALPLDERLIVWDCVRAGRDGEILVEVNEGVRETLIDAMNRDELVDAVEALDTDEIADLVEDLPPDVVAEVQEGLSHEERAQLRAAMSYPEDSVGARMDFEIVSIQDNVTLDAVLKYLRRLEDLPDHTDQVFVVDQHERLKGTLPVDRILTNQPEARVQDLMITDMLTLNPLDADTEAAQAFERYDLVSAPVVDETGRLVGRLTVNEVVDVIREESDEEAYGAVGLDDDQDIFESIWSSATARWLWLGINLCTAFFASRVISYFDGTIEKVVALAALMPIVAGIAGNSGNQTLTLLVRSMATGQITESNQTDVIKKEIFVAVINGLIWGVIAGLFAWLLYYQSPDGKLLGITMFSAMVLNMLMGAIVAILVPLTLKKMGRDPAMGGSVLLTFITDSGGFFIFLGLASIIFA